MKPVYIVTCTFFRQVIAGGLRVAPDEIEVRNTFIARGPQRWKGDFWEGQAEVKRKRGGLFSNALTIGKQTPKKTQPSTKMDVVQLKVKTIHFLFISY